jgi:7,8-dihydropterin-6-yl-methyl-4-(beta-D-ribofuranosyl)aminobenzene 5'-phosphate synthase
MRTTILVDNTVLFDSPLVAEHGLSLFLEVDGRRVLFDTGASGAFIQNARRLEIDLLDLDYIVLSHGHCDHTGGLYHLLRLFLGAIEEGTVCCLPRLIAHPHCFYRRSKRPVPEAGPLLTADDVRRVLPVDLTVAPLRLSPNLFFLGEVPRTVPFEAFDPGERRIVMPDGTEQPDYLLDDTALAYRSRDGLVVITGCAHAGICTTVEHARRVCGDDRIADIVGGLHLRGPGLQLEGTRDYLGGLDLAGLHACHCTSLAAKVALAGSAPLLETGTGLRLAYPARLPEL